MLLLLLFELLYKAVSESAAFEEMFIVFTALSLYVGREREQWEVCSWAGLASTVEC
jgi:hypothetical protein